MGRFRDRLTYANVMATVAVFLALTGVGFAALKIPRNSVGTKQLKKDAVNSSKVAPASIKGGDIDLSSLTTVPTAQNAFELGGLGPSAFQSRVEGACQGGNAIQSIAANGDVVCQATGVGSITGVTAGAGLTGGGTSGDVSLAADTSVLQSRVASGCSGANAIKAIAADGTVTCQPAAAGTITGVTASGGLTGGGTSGSVNVGVDSSVLQGRVTGTCAGATAVQAVNGDGTVDCSAASAVGDVQSATIPDVDPSLIRYGAISGSSGSAAPGEVTSLSPNVPLTMRDMAVEVSAPTGASVSAVLLYIDGQLGAVCEISGPSTGCSVDGPVPVPADSTLYLEAVNGTLNTQTFMVGFRLTPG